MNNRLEQLNVAYKKALGAILLKEFPHQTGLTVVDFLLDPSTMAARVFLGTDHKGLAILNAERGRIQEQLKRHLKTRYTPKLEFVIDDHYLEKMDALFEQVNDR